MFLAKKIEAVIIARYCIMFLLCYKEIDICGRYFYCVIATSNLEVSFELLNITLICSMLWNLSYIYKYIYWLLRFKILIWYFILNMISTQYNVFTTCVALFDKTNRGISIVTWYIQWAASIRTLFLSLELTLGESNQNYYIKRIISHTFDSKNSLDA